MIPCGRCRTSGTACTYDSGPSCVQNSAVQGLQVASSVLVKNRKEGQPCHLRFLLDFTKPSGFCPSAAIAAEAPGIGVVGESAYTADDAAQDKSPCDSGDFFSLFLGAPCLLHNHGGVTDSPAPSSGPSVNLQDSPLLGSHVKAIIDLLSTYQALEHNRDTHAAFDLGLASVLFTNANVQRFVWGFFHYFHDQFPILHRPTFDVQAVSTPLLLIVVLFGSMSFSPSDMSVLSRKFFDVAEACVFKRLAAMPKLRQSDNSSFNDTELELFQACLLTLMVQNNNNDISTRRRLRLLRIPYLVAAVRASGLFAYNRLCRLEDGQQWAWHNFISDEKRIRVAAWTYMTDCTLALFFNSPPQIAISEMTGGFPCGEVLFEARSESDFHQLNWMQASGQLPNTLPKLLTDFFLRPIPAPDLQADVTITAANMLIVICALLSLTMTLRMNLLASDNVETLLRATYRWKSLWDSFYLDGDNQEVQHKGFERHALEYWWLARVLLKAIQSGDRSCQSNLEPHEGSTTVALHGASLHVGQSRNEDAKPRGRSVLAPLVFGESQPWTVGRFPAAGRRGSLSILVYSVGLRRDHDYSENVKLDQRNQYVTAVDRCGEIRTFARDLSALGRLAFPTIKALESSPSSVRHLQNPTTMDSSMNGNSKVTAVHQSGVYCCLPTYPSIQGRTAIVAGATGISGWNTIRSLLDSPDRWSKIYAISRSPPEQKLMDLLSPEQQSRIHHLAIDFSCTPEKISKSLNVVREPRTYVFFYAYLQPKTESSEKVWTNTQKLVEVNAALFASFLKALEIAKIVPERILLQTGGKNYGLQYGRIPQPCIESDPQPRHLEPNFYYPQEDALFDYCKRHPETSWNVIRPFAVLGSALKAQMSGLYLFCVYSAVQAHKKETLQFPGDWVTWQGSAPSSTARLTGYLSEWAVLHDSCRNQSFNAVDTNALTFERLFAELARWYGNEKGAAGPTEDLSKFETSELKGGKHSPLGHGPPVLRASSFKMLDWAQEQCNKDAWREIMEASKGAITTNPFEDDVVKEIFQLLDIYFSIVVTVSMSKARRQGWTGFVDTIEAAFESATEMVSMGLLPPLTVASARPMI
ncbi:hypothetical protein OPT61_g1069 [Boeremia exigua]|uniref:Uncharacterized protein n=1 Tax=Boeremia exigua TaxID=749465 RepID=A0ACC2IRK3_9PLEO|nr:hypothetical protein OPT61_g1069 [Boeremia exigua]